MGASGNRTKEELIKYNLLVKHKAGSYSYGTNIESSDEDYRGIFVADAINIRTPFFQIDEVEDKTETDTKLYELSQYMKLCVACNPNIIETLWVDESDIISSSPGYELLRGARNDLLSSQIAMTTTGYALSQLKRIKGHNKWINNPQPEQQPKPSEHLTVVQWLGTEKNLHPDTTIWRNDHRLIPFGNDMFGVVVAPGFELWDDNGNLNDKFEGDRTQYNNTYLMVIKWNRDEFKTRLEKWQQYWTWKKERNKVRSALEENHGYDTKHAMHLVRLLRMGVEALRDGVILVKRPDAEELLSIRNGAWTYDELVSYADKMKNDVDTVWLEKTSLPEKVNIELAADLIMAVQDSVWSTN